MGALDGNMVLAPWCERIACEEEVKKRTSCAADKKIVDGEAPALSGSAASASCRRTSTRCPWTRQWRSVTADSRRPSSTPAVSRADG